MRRSLRACVRTKRGRDGVSRGVRLEVFVEHVHTLYSLEQSHHQSFSMNAFTHAKGAQ